MLSTINHDDNLSPFIEKSRWITYCSNMLNITPNTNILNELEQRYLLPIYKIDNKKYCLKNDLELLKTVLHTHERDSKHTNSEINDLRLLNKKLILTPRPDTLLGFVGKRERINTVYFPAVRNLIEYCAKIKNSDCVPTIEYSYFGGGNVITCSRKISEFINNQFKREKRISSSKIGIFANSAYYMGSKKVLGSFLVESLSRISDKIKVIIDLMCGSGAASQALSTVWPTYASDAQLFCQRLAYVQGKGFTTKRARNILSKILTNVKINADSLNQYLRSWIEKEDFFFHSNINNDLLINYKKFITETSCYPKSISSIGKILQREVEKRKTEPKLFPYCLFSAYFANIYFGLRQSVEIDSIRYAIDQLDKETDRDWVIGVLVATLSAIGSGYAGQFAQPVEPNLKNFTKILESRARSVTHEFSVRLNALAKESEKSYHQIKILPGPWQCALREAYKSIKNEEVIVYLDAPYKREEYSRYYHVLETIVSYNYPSATAKGRLPDKKKGERFNSAFFTKNRENVETELVEIIASILKRNWTCAWSYSDSGDASIIRVIEKVYNLINCQVVSFATPYYHKPQGKRKQKKVTEYLILLIPLDFVV